MCDTCGCPHEEATIAAPSSGLRERRVEVQIDVLHKNNELAERNRLYFLNRGILALNLVSSPGSGKTSILEATLRDLRGRFAMSVIEGDQQTSRDAERIKAAGVDVVQVNTGAGCHLDSRMVARALEQLAPAEHSLLFIENVGNLVCPALFDLGEHAKVVILSVTEGDDKPLKYPHMFHAAKLCLINKTDLLPHVDFSLSRCREHALSINPHLDFIEMSARSSEGMKTWYGWLGEELKRLATSEKKLEAASR